MGGLVVLVSLGARVCLVDTSTVVYCNGSAPDATEPCCAGRAAVVGDPFRRLGGIR
jgi:hypothetical protein